MNWVLRMLVSFPSNSERYTLHICSTDSLARQEAERFIANRFADKLEAKITSFMPTLLVVRNKQHSIVAACGVRPGTEQRLFLETYLDEPIERTIGELTKQHSSCIARQDIVEIGNGGGSIAWIDAANSLHVGPKSAGSTPGPVAYGRGGTAPTTTDANLITGRINTDNFAGGEIKPDLTNVKASFQTLADQLSVDAMDVAHGVLNIANSNMVNALKLISVNRGHDPRDFSLMAFGGGGALHATALGKELNARKVIIPPFAGVFSAWGMLMIDLRRDYIQTYRLSIDEKSKPDVVNAFNDVISKANDDYRNDDIPQDKVKYELYIDARYNGQEHTVKINVPNTELNGAEFIEELSERFHKAHQQEYTFRLDNSGIEIVNIHLVAFGLLDKAKLEKLPVSTTTDASIAIVGKRLVDFYSKSQQEATIYDREKLQPGMTFSGPAIIEESTTTTVVLPDNRVEVDDFGGLHIYLRD